MQNLYAWMYNSSYWCLEKIKSCKGKFCFENGCYDTLGSKWQQFFCHIAG